MDIASEFLTFPLQFFVDTHEFRLEFVHLISLLVRLVLTEVLKFGRKESGILTVHLEDSVHFDASHNESMVVSPAFIYLFLTLIVHIVVDFFQVRGFVTV